MSETVQITIIIDDQKKEIKVTHDLSKTLMSTLLASELVSDNFCGGRGVCGRCRVQFLQAAPFPTTMERKVFSPDKLRQGYRLACMAKPKNNCVVHLHFIASPKMDIITDMTEISEKSDFQSQTETFDGNDVSGYMIAVDLGTTTIAMQLMDMASGQAIDTYCALNPQRSYGADVLSRIQAADMNQEYARAMRESVWKVLQDGVERFRHSICTSCDALAYTCKDSINPIRGMCIAGNTTMEHLLMGLPTESLGRSPFEPVEIGLQECRMPQSGTELTEKSVVPDGQCADAQSTNVQNTDNGQLAVYLAPGISTFVGGDIVAGLYYCHLLDEIQEYRDGQRYQQKQDAHDGQKYRQEQDAHDGQKIWQEQNDHNGQRVWQEPDTDSAALFIDLGTNGEMSITDGNRMIVTATAAGPAFEGGAGASVHGSDMIAITASMLEQGIIDETGLLAEPYFEEGIAVPVPNKEETIYLTQKDIRDLQMAKAAVRAGVEILCEKMGNPAISAVYLAGGFGYYLDVEAAVKIGLLPKSMQGKAKAAGNTSLAGAFLIGRDLLLGRLNKVTLERKLSQIKSINLAEQEDFETLYLKHLNFYESRREDTDDARQ